MHHTDRHGYMHAHTYATWLLQVVGQSISLKGDDDENDDDDGDRRSQGGRSTNSEGVSGHVDGEGAAIPAQSEEVHK